MVADIATVTSFVVLVLTNLYTIPLFFEWLTRLELVSRIIRDFFLFLDLVLALMLCQKSLSFLSHMNF